MDTKQKSDRHADLSVCAVWLDEVCGDYVVRLHDGVKWNEVLRQRGPIVNCTKFGVDLAAKMPTAKRVDSHDALVKALKEVVRLSGAARRTKIDMSLLAGEVAAEALAAAGAA